MTKERAARILRLLNWKQVDFVRELNTVAGTKYRPPDINKWMKGTRPFPPAARVFLRMAVRQARLERWLGRD